MGNVDLGNEDMQRYVEEQKKKMDAMLAAMTPEEHADAEARFAAMREADEARLRKTLEDARAVMEMNTVREHGLGGAPLGAYVPDAARKMSENPSRFCPNCGARADGGNFCEYCGSPLNK